MTPLTYELIRRKRDGAALEPAEIRALIEAYTRGDLPDYQMSALLMAVFFRGLSRAELGAWTTAMIESGERLDLSGVPGVKVDKHSTGGVGDKISIPLAPLVAACGVPVPMISGRGLGHTGGTLDKLESIPGFQTGLPAARFREVLARTGACLAGATPRLAPADRRLYALRDATATVESIPLIASSIVSKKIAEGADALVLDVKVGSGAFMKDLPRARELASTLLEVAGSLGQRAVALLTAMDAPLGRAIGNSLEIAESVAVLRGEGPADVEGLTVELGAEMLVLGGAAGDLEEGRARIRAAIGSGAGLQKLAAIVEAQGGDPAAIHDPRRLPQAGRILELRSARSGVVAAIDAGEVGLTAVALGAGRARKEDAIDPAVGFVLERVVGDAVERGDLLARVHAGAADARGPLLRLGAAYRIEEGPATTAGPLLIERLAAP